MVSIACLDRAYYATMIRVGWSPRSLANLLLILVGPRDELGEEVLWARYVGVARKDFIENPSLDRRISMYFVRLLYYQQQRGNGEYRHVQEEVPIGKFKRCQDGVVCEEES